MTKKILAWLLAAMMLLSLAACAAKETPDAEDTNEESSAVQETPDTTEDQPEVTKPSDEETDKTDTEAEKPDTEPDEADPEDTTTEDSKPETSEPEDTQPEDTTTTTEEPSDDELMVDPPAENKVDLAAVRTAIVDQLGLTDPLNLDADALNNLYGIDPSLIAQSASFTVAAGTFPDEVIMVEAVSDEAVATIQEKLQSRLDEVLVQSQSYDAENYKAAQSCQVRVNGRFVSLILSPKQADIAAIYASYVG
mgnify:FL=1